ncbi:MAG: hypothetical protein SQA66_07380 [Candidatus Fervidibacter sacchari]
MAIGERMGGRGSCRAKNGSDWRRAIGERQRIAKWRDEKMGVLKFLTSFGKKRGNDDGSSLPQVREGNGETR